MDNTQRFSNRVDNYVKYRPGYPKEVLRILAEEVGYGPQQVIADIGSGTGISTALFLENGNKVFAVEPNGPMREAAEELLSGYPGFVSVEGTAERTGLEAGSVDLIVAGQAFHWFEPVATSQEFRRIARAGADIVLMWNERQVDSDFEKAYEELLRKYGTDYTKVDHRNISDEKIGTFFQPQPFRLRVTGNGQDFSWERLKGRLLSSSYIPVEQGHTYDKMISDLREIFDQFQREGHVSFDYETKLYIGRAKG